MLRGASFHFLSPNPAVPARYESIRCTVRIKGDGTREQFCEIHETVQATSPNYFNLPRRHAPILGPISSLRNLECDPAPPAQEPPRTARAKNAFCFVLPPVFPVFVLMFHAWLGASATVVPDQ